MMRPAVMVARTLLLVAGTIAFLPSPDIASGQPGATDGIWSAAGRRLDQAGSPPEVRSPNELLAIRERDGMLFVAGKNRTAAIEGIPATPSLTEVVWAPNSSAFVVNASDGGLVGTWDAYIYLVGADERVTSRDLRRVIEPQVQGFARCTTNEAVNVGAAAWPASGSELLVVVEVPPHASCRNSGAVTGYRVSVREWKVVERLPEPKLRSIWGRFLGPRLMN